MKIAIINKSDSTGGAAVVSFRLMNALRRAGEDAVMVVAEKLTDSPFVFPAASSWRIKLSFILERLKIFLYNGFNRSTLFKIDTATDGLPLYRHPEVKNADVVMLNWVNQGMLSLKDIERLIRSGKIVLWTMHDMWCFTGICHHSGECNHYERECHHCPLLKGAVDSKLAYHVQKRKKKLYRSGRITFVAVSNWLANRGEKSSLFEGVRPCVIPNAFPFEPNNTEFSSKQEERKQDYTVNSSISRNKDEIIILFGAARLDDPIKGLPILVDATKILSTRFPEESRRMRLVTFGDVRNEEAFSDIEIAHTHLGRISGSENLRNLYGEGDIVVSTSLYETLPGTLVEGQAYGCLPVAFSRGGQGDIIDHLKTGYLVEWSDDIKEGAARVAEGLVWAFKKMSDPEEKRDVRRLMFQSSFSKFNEEVVAEKYMSLMHSLKDK